MHSPPNSGRVAYHRLTQAFPYANAGIPDATRKRCIFIESGFRDSRRSRFTRQAAQISLAAVLHFVGDAPRKC
jgi:hypothetical protein